MMMHLSIQEACSDLRCGLVTPTELLSEALAHIDEHDGLIQAFVTVLRQQALKEAEEAEREQRSGLFRSPLHGIPLAIKDLLAIKDVRLTAGSQVLADYIAPEDATVVARLRQAGAVLIGKTNTHEFAYGTYTPPTRNPWESTHVPGGSSGGSAAAVAAGMCLGAIGSDTGGSIRIPAACCGVTGLKPTYGRVSCAGVIPLSWSLDHVGPLGRSARDCAIIFDSIAAYDPRDPNSVSRPPDQTHSMLGDEQASGSPALQGLTLGIPQDDAIDPLDPEVRQAWRNARLVLQEAGARICDVRVPRASMELYRTIQKPEATLAHRERGWLDEKQELYSQITRQRLLDGLQISAVDYLQAQQQRRAFASALRATLQPVDALLLPAQPMPAVEISQIGQQITIEGRTEPIGEAMLRLTMPFNLAGLPALAFPCGLSARHLPLGLQVVGRPFEEGLILRIVHAYQQLTDWHRRRPGA